MSEVIITILFLLLLAHYIVFIVKIGGGLKKINKNITGGALECYVSIVIPFRNESANILKNLRCIEKLNYPKDKFEVIYVDDFSDDDGKEKLAGAVTAPHIKIITAPQNNSERGHKKRAVKYGIANAKGDIIVTTDADCTFGKDWLKALLSGFDDNTAFISGPVRFIAKGGYFQKLQALEFAGLVLTGAGLIGCRRPAICNAANIAYRKNVFNEVNGFDDNINLSSGDDEFLMQKISKETKHDVKFCFIKEAVVKTEANKTLREFIQQRKRWASKSVFYKNKPLIMQLVFIYFYYVTLVALPVLSLFAGMKLIFLFVIGFILKLTTEKNVIDKGKELLELNYNGMDFIIAELFQILYIILLSAAGLFGNYKWKERSLKR